MEKKSIGIVFIIIGIIIIAYNGISFATAETVVNSGLMKTIQVPPIQYSPIIGLALLVVGVTILSPSKKN